MTLGVHTAMQRARAEQVGMVTPYWTPVPTATKLKIWSSMRCKRMANTTSTTTPAGLVLMMMTETFTHQCLLGNPSPACTPTILQLHPRLTTRLLNSHCLNPLHWKVLLWTFPMVSAPSIFLPAARAQFSPISLPVVKAQSVHCPTQWTNTNLKMTH